MSIFNPKKNEKLLEILSKARIGFGFDQKGVRNRLLMSIEELQISTAERKIRELTHKSFMRRHRMATGFALLMLVVVGSGSALAQADISNPGDRFHAMDQLGERLLLKLPLPDSQRAEMQADFVHERNKELDYLLQAPGLGMVNTEAVKESQKSLHDAIEQARMMKEASEIKGKKEQTEKMTKVLNRLEILANEQEEKVSGMLEKSQDEKVKKELMEQIQEIRKSKERAKLKMLDDSQAPGNIKN
jgi:hypothetical protein